MLSAEGLPAPSYSTTNTNLSTPSPWSTSIISGTAPSGEAIKNPPFTKSFIMLVADASWLSSEIMAVAGIPWNIKGAIK